MLAKVAMLVATVVMLSGSAPAAVPPASQVIGMSAGSLDLDFGTATSWHWHRHRHHRPRRTE